MKKIILRIFVLLLMMNVAITKELNTDICDSVHHVFLGLNMGFIDVTQKKAYNQISDTYCWNEIPIGFGNGYYVGLNLKYNLEKFDKYPNSVSLNTTLKSYNTNFKIQGDSFSYLNEKGEFEKTATEHRIKIDYFILSNDLLYNVKLFHEIPVELSLGINFSIPLITNYYQTYNIILGNVQFFREYDNDGKLKYQYLNDDKTIVVYNNKIEDLKCCFFGVRAQINFPFKLYDNLIINPEIGYFYPISNMVEDRSWKNYYFNAGIGILDKLL